MLQRQFRLPFGEKKPPLYSYKTPYFIVKVFSSSLQSPRFGFVVSKKTAKNAVSRNRVKRQVRAVIEEHLSQIKSGYDILFIVQKGALGAKTADIRQVTKSFLERKQLIA